MITQERVRDVLDYNAVTGVFTWKDSHNRKRRGHRAGSPNADGYVMIGLDKGSYYGHRLAFMWMGYEMPELVDHIDQNKGNNAWANLRPACKSSNGINSKVRKDSISGCKGVYYWEERGKYSVRIDRYGKRKTIGYYDDFFEACCARKSAEIEWEKRDEVRQSEGR